MNECELHEQASGNEYGFIDSVWARDPQLCSDSLERSVEMSMMSDLL